MHLECESSLSSLERVLGVAAGEELSKEWRNANAWVCHEVVVRLVWYLGKQRGVVKMVVDVQVIRPKLLAVTTRHLHLCFVL